jgi:hypothetical protein
VDRQCRAGGYAHRAGLHLEPHRRGGQLRAPQRAPRLPLALRAHDPDHEQHDERSREHRARHLRLEPRTERIDRHRLDAPRGLLLERERQLLGCVLRRPRLEVERVAQPGAHLGEALLDALQVLLEAEREAGRTARGPRQRRDHGERERDEPRPGRGRAAGEENADRDREREGQGRRGGRAQRHAQRESLLERAEAPGEVRE